MSLEFQLDSDATVHHLLLQQNPERFDILVPAYPGSPGKLAVN